MPNPHYAVETVLSGVAIIAEDQKLAQKFATELSKRSLEPTILTIDNPELPNNTEIEQYLIFLTPKLANYLFGEGRGALNQICSSNLKTFILQSYSNNFPLAFPDNSYRITLGEYLGLDNEGSPFLNQLFSSITQDHRLILSGTGIEQYALMNEPQVLDAVSNIIASSHLTNHFSLYNPNTISLNNLAHNLIQTLPYSVAISYGDGLTPPPISPTDQSWVGETDPTLALATQALAEYKIEPSVSAPPKPSQPPTIVVEKPPIRPTDPAEPPNRRTADHLTPLKPSRRPLSTLEFVPASPRRSLGGGGLHNSLINSLRGKGLRIIARGLLLGLILYLGTLVLAGGISYLTLRSLYSQISQNNFSGLNTSRPATIAGKYLEANAVVFGLKEGAFLLDAYNQTLVLGSTLSQLNDNLRGIANYVFTDSGDNIASNISSSRLLSEDLYQQISLLDGTLPTTTPELLSRYDDYYQKLKTNLTTVKKNILIGKAALSIMPDFLGLGGRAKYAILFQNNMELRATGGFIGSFALMSFENGKLYDLPLYDVYSADGQLKGHVEPPTPIKEILGEANWYLRDSNFDPDFPTSARRAEWFIKKTMNQDVAGTIGVNLETLKALLTATGPLTLADYNETVNASNLYERAQFHAEVNFFPGSTAKKEFLGAVSDSLFAKLKTGDSGVLVKALLALAQSLEQNDLQVSALNSSSEHVLQTLGWNGEVASKPCVTTPCYEDYFYQVDSNFGVNKANFYISKSTNLELTIGKDGNLTHLAKTIWKNQATSNAWPAGTYKNYTRTYLPTHSSIASIQVGDKILSSKEYTTTIEHDKLVVAYLVSVPVGESVTATVTYQSSTPLISGTHYTLYHQKQSGVKASDSIKISLAYPLFYKPTQISPAGNVLPQQLVFEFPSDTDHRISVQF